VDDRESLMRAIRDLEAAEERVRRNAERVYEDTRAELIAELLPIVDNLDRTIRAAEQAQCARAVVEGAQMVRAQLDRVLAGYGATRIDAMGKVFDPKVHEALSAVPVHDPRWDRRVVDQLEAGYTCGDRLLRPAKVSVGVLERATLGG
jgi:molecular chaperone GrpE